MYSQFFTQHFVVLLSTIVLCFDSHFIFFLPWSFFRKGRLQPWGYLYGLIWPSHTETIHSHLLLSSVTRVPLSKRETQRDVNRLERCIVHLQDECKLSLICELHASLALSKDLLTFGPRLSRCHLAWALAALLRPYRPYPLVPCAPVTLVAKAKVMTDPASNISCRILLPES